MTIPVPLPASLVDELERTVARARAFVLASMDAVVEALGDSKQGNDLAIPLAGAAAELAETGGRSRRTALTSATIELRHVLSRLQRIAPPGHPGLDKAAECVASALAILHPLSAQSARDTEEDAVDTFPLSKPRPKPSKKRKIASSGERRERVRHELSVDIGMQSATNFFTGYSEDLSDGGLFIATHKLLAVGAKLVVTFVLPSGHAVTSSAKVVWLREPRDSSDDLQPGMGVRLIGLTPADREAIAVFLRARPPEFYDV
jgi:uncharacterized protein (TIGR02266 family)